MDDTFVHRSIADHLHPRADIMAADPDGIDPLTLNPRGKPRGIPFFAK